MLCARELFFCRVFEYAGKYAAMIKTKSVYDPIGDGDGLRVLVTRLWPRGVRKGSVDLWIKDLGPSREILRAYKDGRIGWEEFRDRYLAEYMDEGKDALLRDLVGKIKGSGRRNATLMCACREEARCHRGILREKLGS